MKYEIGTELKDSKVAGFALAELKKYLARTEVDEQAPDVIELSLGPPSDFPADCHDGFRLVRSTGKLSIQAAQDRGLLNGVYEVLWNRSLPRNPDQNKSHVFHPVLSHARQQAHQTTVNVSARSQSRAET